MAINTSVVQPKQCNQYRCHNWWGSEVSGVSYLRKAVDESVDVCRLGHLPDLLQGHGAAAVTIGDVLGDGAIEEHGLLGDDG